MTEFGGGGVELSCGLLQGCRDFFSKIRYGMSMAEESFSGALDLRVALLG